MALGDVLVPRRAKPDRFTPERGLESDPGNVGRFVPVRDPSGRISDARRDGMEGAGGGFGGRGGTGSPGTTPEPTEAELTSKEIEVKKADIISTGGKTTTRTSTERGTGARLEITETRGRGGNLIRETTNLDTGDFRVNLFGAGKGGGSVAFQKGVTGTGAKEPPVTIDVKDTKPIIIDLPATIKNVLIKRNEIYNPNLGGFVSSSDPSGQGTGIIRPPTIKEQRIIDIAKKKGSLPSILKFIAEKEAAAELKLFGTKEENFKERFEAAVKRGKTNFLDIGPVKKAFDAGFRDFDEALAAGAFDGPTTAQKKAALKEKFPPIRVFEFASEGIVRGGEFIGGGRIEPGARALTKDVIEDILVFSTFAPLISTGTAATTKQQATVQVKKLSDKDKLKKLIALREEIARTSELKLKNFVKKEITNIKNNKLLTPQEKFNRLRNFEVFIREARGQIKIVNGRVVPVVDLASVKVTTSAPEIIIGVPKLAKIPALRSTLSSGGIPGRVRAGEVGRTFGAPSEFAGTGQFERTEAIGVRLAQETKTITNELRQTGLSQGQITNLRQRMDSLNRELLKTKTNQELRTGLAVNQISRQMQRNRQRQDSLTRQLSATRSAQKSAQLSRQLSQVKTAQASLSKQLSQTRTAQRSLTKQVNRLRGRTGRAGKPFKPKKLIRPKLFGVKKKKISNGEVGVSGPKKFQVFVRKRGKDILFKSFKTKRKARTELKKRLSTTLRASGFILDKKLGVKVKPKVTKGFRLGKTDKFRLVEKRNKRLDTKIETVAIKEAKKLKKSFNGKSNFKKVKTIKTKSGRKK